MIEPASFYRALHENGLTFFTGVPDSLLKDLCAYINDEARPGDHVINANEGSAIALAAGYHLATGKVPVVYLQNSGIGNAINPLLSLADPAVYALPMLLLIGWRGEPGVSDEPQHVSQGRVMESLLHAIAVPYVIVDAQTDGIERVVSGLAERIRSESRPAAILIRKGTLAAYEAAPESEGKLALTRSRAIEVILDRLGSDDLIVSTTGMTSREVFAYREKRGQGHEHDFLTVGSMGHTSQVALGIARELSGRRVVCLDGDGAVIMHMGSVAIIGHHGSPNLRHIVVNNGAHDSVGGQPTVGRTLDLPAIALGCGYRLAISASSEEELDSQLRRLLDHPGPSLLEVRVRSDPNTDAGRPTTTPVESKAAFMTEIGSSAG